jgi:hypothetical protein
MGYTIIYASGQRHHGAAAPSLIDTVSILSITVTPQQAPTGTTRTLTVTGASSAGQALNAAASSVPAGVTFTPVGGQPAGQFQWTFVW